MFLPTSWTTTRIRTEPDRGQGIVFNGLGLPNII